MNDITQPATPAGRAVWSALRRQAGKKPELIAVCDMLLPLCDSQADRLNGNGKSLSKAFEAIRAAASAKRKGSSVVCIDSGEAYKIVLAYYGIADKGPAPAPAPQAAAAEGRAKAKLINLLDI